MATYKLFHGNHVYTFGDRSFTVASTDDLATLPTSKTVATYALMVADGTPTKTMIYRVLVDENKGGYLNALYIWFAEGKRIWMAGVDDN